MRLPRRHLAGTVLVIVALLLAVALAACGGGTAGDGVASANGATAQPSASAGTDNASLTDAQKARKFAQCMRDHGVDVTDSQNSTGGSSITIKSTDRAKADAATKACQKYAPGSGGSTKKPDPKALAMARKFAQCMRDHGVSDFPDPDPNGGGIRVDGRQGSDLTPDNPTFQKAQKACEKLLGGGGKLTTSKGTGAGLSTQPDGSS